MTNQMWLLDTNSWEVNANLNIRYNIFVVDGILEQGNPTLLRYVDKTQPAKRQLIVVDKQIEALYGENIRDYYRSQDIELSLCIVEISELVKNHDTVMYIIDAMERFGTLRRSQPFIAMGGGVLLDLAGFAASLYRRGVPHIKVPTNLMAMVDASVGVKTGINIGDKRNRMGTYFPPLSVYLDRRFLRTVQPRDISNGLGEILKLGVIKDARLFELLERRSGILREKSLQDDIIAPEVIQRSVDGMLDELEPNLWEHNLQRCVDFGHSFSPLIEMRSLPDLLHGEAVALDVLFSCYLAQARHLMTQSDVTRVAYTLVRLGLPISHPLFTQPDILWEALADTTRHRNGNQNLPLPQGIGNYTFINDLIYSEVQQAAREMATRTDTEVLDFCA